MSAMRIIGVVLLIAGAILIVMGAVASESLEDGVSTFFTGSLTESTRWQIFGGIALAGVGLLLTIGVIGRSRS